MDFRHCKIVNNVMLYLYKKSMRHSIGIGSPVLGRCWNQANLFHVSDVSDSHRCSEQGHKPMNVFCQKRKIYIYIYIYLFDKKRLWVCALVHCTDGYWKHRTHGTGWLGSNIFPTPGNQSQSNDAIPRLTMMN